MSKGRREPTDAELLAFFRSCANAKPFRAAAMHYGRQRKDHGTNVPVTDDAELNAYKQAVALADEVKCKIKGRK